MEREIYDGNELIAKFSGWTIEPGMEKVNNPFYNRGFDMVQVGSMQYHTSFNWLMPIVEQIETTLFVGQTKEVNIVNKKCNISGGVMGHPRFHGRTKIEAVWLAVVDFIQWANKLKEYAATPTDTHAAD